MKVNVTKCDRCKREIEDGKSNRLTRFNTDYHGTQVDLCTRCWNQFAAWLDSPANVPVGYKLVPRPCPHHVPCADPEGCSGKELVPV